MWHCLSIHFPTIILARRFCSQVGACSPAVFQAMPGILARTIAAACKIAIFQCTGESFLESQGVKDLDVVEIFTVSKSVARAAGLL